MVALKRAKGRIIAFLSERALEALIRKEGAILAPELLQEEWFTEEELEALGCVEVTPFNPLPGEVVFSPTATGKWAKLIVGE